MSNPAPKAGSKRPAVEPASKEEQAKNRKTLRELSRKIETDHESLTQVNSNALAEVQCQANEMFEVSKQEARSAALDANLLHGVSRLGAEQAGKLDKQSPEEFVKRLLAKYGIGGGENGRQKLNFAVLANDLEAEGVFRTVPSATFLLDSNWAPAVPKEKKQSQKKQRTTDEELYTAQTVNINELQETDEAKAQVSRMEKLLEVVTTKAGGDGRGKVNLFRLLLHPTSFSQTVENFFDFGFLVKDGRVALQADAAGASVSPSKPPLADAYDKGESVVVVVVSLTLTLDPFNGMIAGLLKTQNILKLDFATYRKLVVRWCGEGAPYLPSRGS